MKPLTREWIAKAEGDYITATREFRARKAPNYDACCFHAQQCVEKYLKARLQEADRPFAKTHNLTALLDLLVPLEPLWESLRAALRILNAYAVEMRYPGESADKPIAREALKICRMARSEARQSLRLKP